MEISQLITHLQHIGLPTEDIDKTIAFYKDLGFAVKLDTVLAENNNKVAFMQLGEIVIETYETTCAAGKAGAIDHIAFNVTDVKQVFDIVKSKGYNMLDESLQQLPFWSNGVSFFTILGPNGEKLEFSQIA